MFGPYAPLLRDTWRTRRWRDKLRVWFKAPGWRPADLAAQDPRPAFSLSTVQRFDPPATTAQRSAGLQVVGHVFEGRWRATWSWVAQALLAAGAISVLALHA